MKVIPINELATELKGLKIARYYLMYVTFAAVLHLISLFTGK